MRKEKKLNPVKKLAKKTALRTAYQAQAHAKQAGQEIRGGASGEGPSDNYAQQKVEDKAKEAAEDAAGFAFRSTKIPYKMYRRLLSKEKMVVPINLVCPFRRTNGRKFCFAIVGCDSKSKATIKRPTVGKICGLSVHGRKCSKRKMPPEH